MAGAKCKAGRGTHHIVNKPGPIFQNAQQHWQTLGQCLHEPGSSPARKSVFCGLAFLWLFADPMDQSAGASSGPAPVPFGTESRWGRK